MTSSSRSDLPVPGARRRYARRHPARTAAALGALVALGGAAVAGAAYADSISYDVRFLGDVSVHDDTTGANCHYHVDEARSGFSSDSPRIVVEVAAPSNACGAVQDVFVSLSSHAGDDINLTAGLGGTHD